ncbi:hypothetical protein A2U01_0099574, partial [Trifolium medium]|nr:hypothetical protein [Trifolium medium]
LEFSLISLGGRIPASANSVLRQSWSIFSLEVFRGVYSEYPPRGILHPLSSLALSSSLVGFWPSRAFLLAFSLHS